MPSNHHLRLHLRPSVLLVAVLGSLCLATGCGRRKAMTEDPGASAVRAATVQGQPLILTESEGEHWVHRPPPGALSSLTAPYILKVDPRIGNALDFVMLTEDIPPGQAISPHRHPHAEEIIFIHGGTGLATLAGRRAVVTTGATIYMPRNAVASLRNTGTEPLRIVAVFSRPGYEEYLRDISVREGEVAAPLTAEELTDIRRRHLSHAVYERP